MSWLKGWRMRLRSLLRADRVERERREEMEYHLELETRRQLESGATPEEARRRAAIAVGGVERYAEMTKDARSLAWLSGLSLDFRLGFRMMIRYPGLTIVGGLAMALAICLGAATFELVAQGFWPKLPVRGGDRIVHISLWDASAQEFEQRILWDLPMYRERLRTITDVGAFRLDDRNVVTESTVGPPAAAAEISASAFRIAGVAPAHGRTLLESDEVAGAPLVAVIGHDLFESRFGGDPGVIGSTVQIGRAPATIVGVMPEGFGFPISQNLWLPLRASGLDAAPLEGPSVMLFGRLEDGVTLAQARAEVLTLSASIAAGSPETHEHLRADVAPLAQSMIRSLLREGLRGAMSVTAVLILLPASFNLLVVLFLVLVCANVALLMFARAAARESEMVVRTALGASRRRITLQLFAEALVLGAFAAVVGLAGATWIVRSVLWLLQIEAWSGRPLPIWFHDSLSLPTILYSCGLTVLGAAVAGVMPALKVTRGLGARLRESSAGGGGFRFGGLWTAVIVSQIAITVPFPIVVTALRAEGNAVASVNLPIDEHAILTARVTSGAPREAPDTAFDATLRELEQRLESNPAVLGVTFAERLPRTYHPYRLVEVDAGPAAPLHPQWPAYRISSTRVAADYFDVLGADLVAGRGFNAGDVAAESKRIVVNESFVKRVFGGSNAVGRRVRYALYDENGPLDDPESEPWYEVVGVVPDLGTSYGEFDPKIAAVYHPLVPGAGGNPSSIAVRLVHPPATFAPDLRRIAAAADPQLELSDVLPLNRIADGEVRFYRIWFWICAGATAIALLLSLAGIYAVMSFTVSQRTREIGVRVALGASRGRVITEVFRRPAMQLALGVGAGGAVLLAMMAVSDGMLTVRGIAMLSTYLAIVTAVCLLSWIVPTRRALRVQPMDALRIDG